MTTLTQRSFSSGELSPSLYARVDFTRYGSGLRTCRNAIVLRYGGLSNRPGTSFVSEVSDSSKKVRLIPFIFSQTQTYVLEFGDQYMRVHKEGVQLTESSKTITGITKAAVAVVTSTAHGYSNGDEVYINGVAGMVEVNNRNFKIQNVTANTFELVKMGGGALNSTAFGTYTSGGLSYKIYEIVTDYLEAELPELNYVQSADVVTIVHPDHKPMELSRLGDTNWSIDEISFSPDVDRPGFISATKGATGTNTYRYKVTAVDAETFEESLAADDGGIMNITAITNANPCVVSSTAHGLANDDEIIIENVGGMTELNGRNFYVDNVTANTFELYGVDSTDYGTFLYGEAFRVFAEITTAAAPTATAPHVITWNKVETAVEYNIYKETNGVYGQIGVASGSSFNDININPNTSYTPPLSRNPFVGIGNYPSVVTYIQQRLCFANVDNDPEKIFMSKAGNFKNFTTSSPSQSDDAITFNMAGRQINEVKSMLDLGRLVIMTSGGEWSVSGDQAGVITPTTINTKQYSYNGSGQLSPIIIDGAAIYQQARGSIIRDLNYNFEVDGYTGNDLTIFSAHLFDNYTIVDWAFQQIPHSILWVVRSDGKLLGLTFVRSQEVMAWHVHDFDGGEVENVAVVPDGNEDYVYVTVKRTINGVVTRYVERLNSRQINDIEDVKLMDSSLTYDGRNTSATTATVVGGTLWDETEELSLGIVGQFTAAEVGNSYYLTVGDDTIRFEVTQYISSGGVKVRPHKTVPVSMRGVSTTTWSRAVDQLSGLWHLEGKEVSVFGDGFVVASPNNPSYNVVTVVDGTISLDKTYAVIHVGLPYVTDVETLDVDTPSGETLSDKKKIVGKVNLYVEETRGLWVGKKPTGSDLLNGLTEPKIRNNEDYDSPVSLKTDTVGVNIESNWDGNGRVFIRQVDPVPMTILSVSPAGKYPFSN